MTAQTICPGCGRVNNHHFTCMVVKATAIKHGIGGATKTSKRPRTHIVEHQDGYHICYHREDGFSAYIDSPYFSAICLGYFPTQDSAWHAIKEYQMAGTA